MYTAKRIKKRNRADAKGLSRHNIQAIVDRIGAALSVYARAEPTILSATTRALGQRRRWPTRNRFV
jgi:hypothetical protein